MSKPRNGGKISLGARVHDVCLDTLVGRDCCYRLRDRSLDYPSENKRPLCLHGSTWFEAKMF